MRTRCTDFFQQRNSTVVVSSRVLCDDLPGRAGHFRSRCELSEFWLRHLEIPAHTALAVKSLLLRQAYRVPRCTTFSAGPSPRSGVARTNDATTRCRLLARVVHHWPFRQSVADDEELFSEMLRRTNSHPNASNYRISSPLLLRCNHVPESKKAPAFRPGLL